MHDPQSEINKLQAEQTKSKLNKHTHTELQKTNSQPVRHTICPSFV